MPEMKNHRLRRAFAKHIVIKNKDINSDLPQAMETPLRRMVVGLPEELWRRITKKFIDFVPLC